MTAAGVAADEVLESPYAADDLARKAHFVKGRSLQAAGDEAGALTHYREVTDARTRDAAESYYHIISILYKQGKLKEAEQEVFAFLLNRICRISIGWARHSLCWATYM